MFVAFIISIFFFILSYINKKGPLDSTLTFFGVWSFIIGMYVFGHNIFLPISARPPMILCLGLPAFYVGSMMRRKIGIPQIYSNNILAANITYKIFLFVMILIMGIAAFRSIPYLLMGSTVGDIRYNLREEVLGDITPLFIYFAEPVSLIVIHFNTLRILKKRKVKISISTIILTLVLSELCIGGRFMIYYTALDFFFVFMYQKYYERKKINIKANIKYILLFALFFYLFGLITGFEKVWDTIYSYSCGCIKLLDVKLDQFDSYNSYTFGLTSLNGFIRPVFTFLRSIIGLTLPDFLNLSEELLLNVEQVEVVTAKGDTYNGFVSIFYAFYVDGGWIGVAIGSAIWGYITRKLYYNLLRYNNESSIFIYLLILQAIMMSMLKFPFVAYQYALAYVYYYIIWKSKFIKI